MTEPQVIVDSTVITVVSVGEAGPTGTSGAGGSIADAGGTANAITAAFTTPFVLLEDQLVCKVVASAANSSTTPTFAPDGLTAHTITARGGQALRIGDIAGAGFVMDLEYNLAGTRWELLNPAASGIIAPATTGLHKLAAFGDTSGGSLEDTGVSVSTDGTLAGNSDTLIPTQKAVKAYADQIIASADAMVYKGATDCSGTPNYPAADAGWTYRVSVAGKIGGASGKVVEVGDFYICNTDSTASGNEATVGTKWNVIQTNLDGAVIGPASATDGAVALFDSTTGKLIKNSFLTFSGPTSGRTYTLPDSSATLLYSGGALGTPSGGVATNLTGTASGLTAGAVALSGVTGSYTSGGAVYASSTSGLAVGALLAANGVVLGGGAGGAPATLANFIMDTSNTRLQMPSGYSIYDSNNKWEIGGTNGTLLMTSLSAVGWAVGNNRGTSDTTINRGSSPNQLVFAGTGTQGGGATSRAVVNKAVTGIADATATAIFTVTVPNAAHSASIRVRVTGSMGAGGAIGANESSQDAQYMINVTRTAGVNAVATIGAVVGQATAASVAGAGNIAVTADLSSISGAVGVSNTFTIRATLTKSGGSSANHTALVFAELLNANATGVTIA